MALGPPYLTPLDEQIPASSDEVSGVEARLVFGGDKLSLGSQLVSVLHRADRVVLEGAERGRLERQIRETDRLVLEEAKRETD